MKRLLTYLSILVSLVLMSCYGHKELEYGGAAEVSVFFDWVNSPEASPVSMHLLAFPPTGRAVAFPFAGHEGGEFVVPSGTYQFIAFNDDTEDLETTGTTWDDFEIYARNTDLMTFSPMFARRRASEIPRAPYTEDQDVIFQPDPLWTSADDNHQLVALDHNLLVMTMRNAITEFTFNINNVENLEHVTEIAATVSGMSGGWLPSTGKGINTECIIPFNLEKTGPSSLTGHVRTFGHCPNHVENADDGEEHEHDLVIYVQMSDGHKYYYTFNVTEELHEASPPGGPDAGQGETGTDISITIDDIPLPEPLTNGSGIHPEVDEWQEVNIVIPL